MRYRDLLEEAGIRTFIRNEALSVTDAPIDEFLPNLCVMDDSEATRACQMIKDHDERMAVGVDVEVTCPSCGEINPGNFDSCFSCQGPIDSKKKC